MSPVAIISFNRPDYLSAVLDKLASQVVGRDVFLFQDGAVNPFSGIARAEQRDIDECVAVFKRLIPHGMSFTSKHNLGVALNYDRAERYVFETLRTESAVFMEDDMVPSGRYIQTIDRLLKWTDDRVAYVACYGEPGSHQQKPIQLGHHWGFGLKRYAWLRMQKWASRYMELVSNCDYMQRDDDRIRALFSSWGLGCPASSQDVAKAMSCAIEGLIRINTPFCLGRYIGEHGLHMTPELYKEYGYGEMLLHEGELPELERITDADHSRIMAESLGWMK